MINLKRWENKKDENKVPKLLKDVRCQDKVTYFLYEIEGIEKWYDLNQLKEMEIELPSVFKSEKQRLNDLKKVGRKLIFKNYDDYESEDVLDSYSIIMNNRRISSIDELK